MQRESSNRQLPLTAGKTKRCGRCEQEKALDDFALCKSRPDGFQNRCRACQALAHQEWLARNPERRIERNARTRQHYRDNPEYHAQKRREFDERNPTYRRDYYLKNRERFLEGHRERTVKRKYGLSIAEYEAFLARGCAICGATAEDARLNLDHDHGNGRIRDCLCSNCNRGIGHLQDDPRLLQAAIHYLERHRSD